MTNFLYPFLDAEERDQDALLRDLAASAAAKAAESAALRASTLDANRELIATAAAEMARRFAAGGRMFAFGNGGSSTDVATLVALFARPPGRRARSRPGRSPPTRRSSPRWATTSASTSCSPASSSPAPGRATSPSPCPPAAAPATSWPGSARPAPAACTRWGSPGYDGGEFATSSDVDVCFTVRSQSVHRIQEAQALVGHALWTAVGDRLRTEGAS